MLPSKSKKRILIVGPLAPAVGGIATYIEGILESNLKKKYMLSPFGTERPTFRLAKDASNPRIMFGIGPKNLIKSTIWTMSHLIKFPLVITIDRPDIVHIHTASYWSFWENTIYCLISKIFRKKVIIHIHGGLFHEFYKKSNMFVRLLLRTILEIPDKVIVLSSRWKNLFLEIVREDKIIVVGNFVDLARFSIFDKKFEHPGDSINVLFVGGVDPKTKGVNIVLKAIPMVINQFKKIMFYFVACDDIRISDFTSNIETYVSHVRFVDYVFGDNKTSIFSTSDIFVLPSYSEGFPITMLEAMAAGLPVIATPVGAIPEVVEEGKNGFLIEVGNYQALAEKILTLAKDRKLRQKMALNNIKKVRKRYDQPIILQELDKLYVQLLGG